MTNTLTVFISYAIGDKSTANRLRSILDTRAELRTLWEGEEIRSRKWQAKLRSEIAKCAVFIMLASRDALRSPRVLQELGAAWALSKPVLVVKTRSQERLRMPIKIAPRMVVRASDIKLGKHFDTWLGTAGERGKTRSR